MNKQEIVNDMNDLLNSRGWKTLSIFLEKDMNGLKEILTTKEYRTLEERNRDKDKLENLRKLYSFPKHLIKENDISNTKLDISVYE